VNKILTCFQLFGIRKWTDEAGPDLEALLAECTENNVQALRLYREGNKKESEGDLKEAVRLYSRAYKLNPELEAVVN
jgi:hypothetical protein